MNDVRAVIFDLDDTLYPERMYALGGLAAAADALGDRLGDPAQIYRRLAQLFDSAQRSRVFEAFLDERTVQDRDDVRQVMLRAYRGHTPRLSLFPDADAALARMRSAHRLGVITDGRAEVQWAKINALGLRARVDEIIVTAELGEGFSKPHARPFEHMADRLTVEPARCAYVGDNPSKDFIAPRALGWKTILVRREQGLYRDVPVAAAGAPHAIVASLDELDACLFQLTVHL
jgi:putative hydrolase of the HAD superfamily